MRGQDPDLDLQTLTRGMLAHRLNPQQPEASLVLAKATGAVPHEGGLRFAVQSDGYRMLRDWIAEGLRPDAAGSPVLVKLNVANLERFLVQPEVQTAIKVEAVFSDGKKRDVTRLTCFESTNPAIDVSEDGIVRSPEPGETTILVRYLHLQTAVGVAFIPQRPGFVWSPPRSANFVDDHVLARLQKLRMNPSELSTDTIFLRRSVSRFARPFAQCRRGQAILSGPTAGQTGQGH